MGRLIAFSLMGGQKATFEDIEDAFEDSAATMTINWSERYNVFRAKTVEEMIHEFCTSCAIGRRAKTGDYGLGESGMFKMRILNRWILGITKTMIATDKSVAKNCWLERLEFLFQFPATFNGKIQKSRLHEQTGGAS